MGDKAVLDAPYGKFSYLEHKNEQQTILIAGGVGITPIISTLRYMRDNEKDRKVLLLLGINNLGDLAFREEFEELQKEMKNLVFVLVVSKDDSWQGEAGFIDRQRIERMMKQFSFDKDKTGVYICGPEIMLKNVLSGLKEIAFTKKQIHFEKFSL